MLRWIFWILIIFWLLSKIKSLFNTTTEQKNNYENKQEDEHSFHEKNNIGKKLKNDAGEYVDFEEAND